MYNFSDTVPSALNQGFISFYCNNPRGLSEKCPHYTLLERRADLEDPSNLVRAITKP